LVNILKREAISGLPLALFSKSKREEVLAISCKSKRFIQLQYSPVLRESVESYFTDVKLKFIPFNFHPAFVYVCRGPDKIKNKSGKILVGTQH